MMMGNLSIGEIETRAGVTFPESLKNYMIPRHQPLAEQVKESQWHCFDLPFTLLCGDIETATNIYKHLEPVSDLFKTQMNIAIAKI